MAFTYTPFDKLIPPGERVVLLSDVEVNDRIDFVEILGRPATRIQFTLTDPADSVSYRINNKITRFISVPSTEIEAGFAPGQQALFRKPHSFWTTRCSEFTSIGETFEFAEGLRISSLEITAATLSTGTTFEIVAW